MRRNTEDKTLYRNYVSKWKFLIQEYELVKQKRHPKFRFAADFYRFHQTHRQTFFKYYHRFRESGADHALVPQKRGRSGNVVAPTGILSNRCCCTCRHATKLAFLHPPQFAEPLAHSPSSSPCPRRHTKPEDSPVFRVYDWRSSPHPSFLKGIQCVGVRLMNEEKTIA